MCIAIIIKDLNKNPVHKKFIYLTLSISMLFEKMGFHVSSEQIINHSLRG